MDEKRTTLTNSLQQEFTSRTPTRSNELHQKHNLSQENMLFQSRSQEDKRLHDRLYLMQQKSEQYRSEISRLRNAIDVRKSTLSHKEHITRRNKALEENLLNVYETTTESVTNLFGSIHEVYNSLRHVIDDDKALDKANNKANNAIQEIQELCKKIDDLKQKNGFPWSISDQGKDENAMEIDVSNDMDMFTSTDLKSLLEQYDKTESLVDELSNDLEQLESCKDEMILLEISRMKKFSTRNSLS
ncbi:hypothetical protein C1645_202643 [Glomus cerebriforme]|uniref:Uncharacterized protein n=1 Tax=Glomus cerebriforme TaxID=658196 RepID=A0A397STA5_9GLOM|nr:hypothetical protein C1645_202643 [Glomus cerebriforme]